MHTPTVAIDLDGTILEKAKHPAFGEPRDGAIAALSNLRDQGIKIVVHTCRDDEPGVRAVLLHFDVPHDEVICGKPHADAYIDDKAIDARSPWGEVGGLATQRVLSFEEALELANPNHDAQGRFTSGATGEWKSPGVENKIRFFAKNLRGRAGDRMQKEIDKLGRDIKFKRGGAGPATIDDKKDQLAALKQKLGALKKAHPEAMEAKDVVKAGVKPRAPKDSAEKAKDAVRERLATDAVKERDERVARLTEGKVTGSTPLSDGGINASHVVTLEDDTKGIFKPKSGETDAFDREVPGGKGRLMAREKNAYDVAKIVGVDDLVPPTAIRKVDVGRGAEQGSIQEWQPNCKVAHRCDDATKYDGTKDRMRAQAFDFVMGNMDRHEGNWMINKNSGKIVLIDNGFNLPDSVHNRARKGFRGVTKDSAIPDSVKDSWKGKWPQIEKTMKANGIGDKAVKCAKHRYDALLKSSTFKKAYLE